MKRGNLRSANQEDPLRLTRRSCEPIKLQIDRWRRRWWRRPSIGDLVLIGDWRLNDWRNLHKHPKNVSSGWMPIKSCSKVAWML